MTTTIPSACVFDGTIRYIEEAQKRIEAKRARQQAVYLLASSIEHDVSGAPEEIRRLEPVAV